MKMRSRFMLVPAALLSLNPANALNLQPMDVAQNRLYPGAQLIPVDFKMTSDQVARIRAHYKVPVLRPQVKAWRVKGGGWDGGWLYLDQVYGLHDIVTYLVAVDDAGNVRGIEVLTCAEGWCDLYTPEWRGHLVGQSYGKWQPTEVAPMVSGATLSSKHVAEGVKKILAIHNHYTPKPEG